MRRGFAGAVASMALVVSFGAAWAAPGAMAANTIYWTTPYNANSIFSGNLDGSSSSPGTVTTTGATVTQPWGIAPDPAAGKIYWANYGGNKISWANLDGSGGGDLATGAATLSGPSGIVVDHVGGKVYWANASGNKVSWANLDGSQGGDLNTGTATVSGPIGVAIDIAAGKLYWANYGGNKISFAKLDNSGGGDINIIGTTVNQPWGVTISSALGRVYWGNFQTNALDFASLDGTGGGVLPTAGAAQLGPMVGAIDPATGKIYWSNWATPYGLMVANVDGSGGGATLYPTATTTAMPVILKAPDGTGAPGVTASGSQAPATLSCSLGAWGADLLGELLYRAPRSFAYQWTLGGAPVAGATASSLAASSPGDYRCAVTATNHAGSTTQTSDPLTLAAPPPPPPPPDTDQDGIADPSDACPAAPRGLFDANKDGCPGPYARIKVSTGGGWTVSRKGLRIVSMRILRVPVGATVKLTCKSCRVNQTLIAKTSTVPLRKLSGKLLRRRTGFTVTVTKLGQIGDRLTLTVKPYGRKKKDIAKAGFKSKHACLPIGSTKTAKTCTSTPPTGP